MAEDDEDLETDPAAAFEALRAEVAALRASLERDHDGPAAPDYAPTLGKIAATLAAIEAHPALQLTPQNYGAEVRAATESIRRGLETEVQRALTTIGQASGEVRRFAGDLRARDAQRRALLYAVAGGLIAGVVLCAGLGGPIARALPARWRVPERMAAATLGQDRWDAGARLMRSADPAAWNGIAIGSQLWRDNGETLEGCARSAARTGKPQRCTVTLAAPMASKPSPPKD